jgi:anti-sigma B factor antagonist
LTDRAVADILSAQMATTFQVSATPEGVVNVAIEGDLDSVTTRGLRDEIEALLTRKPRRLLIDLSQLHTIDSSGVGMLVSLYKGARSHGGELTITGLRDQPLAIVRLLKLDRALLGTT